MTATDFIAPIGLSSPYRSIFDFEKQAPASPARRLASEVSQLAKDGADLAAIKSALADIEKQRLDVAHEALQASLDLAKAKPAKARRFRLAYCDAQHNTVIVDGVEFVHDPDEKSRDHVFLGVYPKDGCIPFSGHVSMRRLREILDDRKIVYSIEYID